MRYFDTIVIHCSATKRGVDFRAADIDNWHREKGYRCIGYHYVIDLDGSVEDGRPLNAIGAHVKDHNLHTVGICYIGGLDEDGNPCDTRTPAQKRALRWLLEHLTFLAVNQGFGCPRIVGHRDLTHDRDCPCFDAKLEYN